MILDALLGPNPVMVVAHPDDECLWGAGLLIRHFAEWTVICCSIPRHDPIRAWKFFDACATLGVHARLLPWVETEPSQPLEGLSLIDLDQFSCVVTHNERGEYGHTHHQSVHEAVLNFNTPPVVVFGYGIRANCNIELTDQELDIKRAALACYDHQSPLDQKPKAEALIDRYFGGDPEGLRMETYLYDVN